MWHFGDFLIGGSSLHWSTNLTLLFDFFFFGCGLCVVKTGVTNDFETNSNEKTVPVLSNNTS